MENVKALLVEDDEDDYLITDALFSDIYEGAYTLDWVRDYDEALRKLESNAYDICLLDYRLGIHNGLELLRQTTERNCKIPIIFLTGQGDRSLDVEAMNAGAADYLVKGQLNAAQLERSIRYAIQQRRFEEERIRRLLEGAARAQAEIANRQKDEFLAMVSHELRGPLNSMLGWIQLLKSGKLRPEDIAKAIETIERNSRLQVRIIEDLLDTTRILNGNLCLQIVDVKFIEVIEEAFKAAFPSAQAKLIMMTKSYDPSVGTVQGDFERLQQVVSNLLSNAIKFTPEGGRIELKLENRQSFAHLIVKDSGIGIDQEFLPYVFEKYKQAKTETGKKNHGLGLGLAIVRHIVEAHNGMVEVESQGEGRGSTFKVSIPLPGSG
ncbi:MAG: hybrid sensor histidine kinase/response regulator [Acidobacteriota bacterium]